MAFPVGWGRKCPIVIDADSVSGAADHTNFPVLITEAMLPSEMFNLSGSYPAKATGADVRFSSDATGTTELACDLIYFDANANKAAFYVKIPTLGHSADTTIYVWYNNAAAEPVARDSTYGGEAVWSDYAAAHVTWGDAPTMDRTASGIHLPYGNFYNENRSLIEVVSNNEYNCFPSLIKLASGTLLLAFRAGAAIHDADNNGYVKVYKSDDAGRSWSSLSTVGAADATVDYRDPNLYQDDDASGTVYLILTKVDADGSAGSDRNLVYYRSTDDGATWDSGTSLTATNGQSRGKPLRLDSGLIAIPWYEGNSSSQTRPMLTTIDPSDQSKTDYTVNATFNTYNEWTLTESSGTVRGYFRSATADGVYTATASAADLSTWSSFTSLITTSDKSPPEAQHVSTGDVLIAYAYERDASTPVVRISRSTDNGATISTTDIQYILSGASAEPISGGSGYYPSFCEIEDGFFAYAIYADSASQLTPTKILTGHFRLDADGLLTGWTNYGGIPILASDTGGMVLPGDAAGWPRGASTSPNLDYVHQNATFTLGALAKLDNYTANAFQLFSGNNLSGVSPNKGFFWGYENRSGVDTKALRVFRALSGSSTDYRSDDNAIADNGYHLCHCSVSSGTPTFYVDGVSKNGSGAGSGTTTGNATYSLAVGAANYSTAAGFLDGNLGLHYCRTEAINQGWAETEYNNWNAPGTFATAGTPVDAFSSIDADAQLPLFWAGNESGTLSVDGLTSLSWLLSTHCNHDLPLTVCASATVDVEALVYWILSNLFSESALPMAWLVSEHADDVISLATTASGRQEALSAVAWGARGLAGDGLSLSYSALVEQTQAAALSWLAQAAADSRLALALGLRSGTISDVRLSPQVRAALVQAIERRIDLALRARSARIH